MSKVGVRIGFSGPSLVKVKVCQFPRIADVEVGLAEVVASRNVSVEYLYRIEEPELEAEPQN